MGVYFSRPQYIEADTTITQRLIHDAMGEVVLRPYQLDYRMPDELIRGILNMRLAANARAPEPNPEPPQRRSRPTT